MRRVNRDKFKKHLSKIEPHIFPSYINEMWDDCKKLYEILTRFKLLYGIDIEISVKDSLKNCKD
jgi:hypothetical protein